MVKRTEHQTMSVSETMCPLRSTADKVVRCQPLSCMFALHYEDMHACAVAAKGSMLELGTGAYNTVKA